MAVREGIMEETKFTHKPVMLSEVLDVFDNLSSGFFLDATLGDGGHAEAILSAHKNIKLVGLDRDKTAIERARQRLAHLADRCVFVNSPYEDLCSIMEDLEIQEISGFLFDMGVSSNQIDDPARGFSYRQSGSLDMRMNQAQQLTADEIVNKWDENDLANVIFEYGDERFSRRIAANIVKNRPLSDTLQLSEVVTEAVPGRAKTHPARRTFQALRICVNQELEQIMPAVRSATSMLSENGRGVVISYHSGEDRIVKHLLRDLESEGPNRISQFSRKVKKPSRNEVLTNPRSRSAKFRALEKLKKLESAK